MKMVGLSGWVMPVSAPRKALSRSVTNVGTPYPENDIFGNVGGMIGYSLQVSCDRKRVQGLHCAVRVGLHALRKLGKGFPVDAIDLVVGFEHMLRQGGISFDEGAQRISHHGAHACRHRWN